MTDYTMDKAPVEKIRDKNELENLKSWLFRQKFAVYLEEPYRDGSDLKIKCKCGYGPVTVSKRKGDRKGYKCNRMSHHYRERHSQFNNMKNQLQRLQEDNRRRRLGKYRMTLHSIVINMKYSVNVS